MRRGCIAVGEIQCDGCQRLIVHGQQYLLMEEGEDNLKRLCTDCCLAKGYAQYKMEKGEQVITFLA